MDGILIVNKPKEFTSHDVVAKVKKMCKVKVGHTGTLDPMATGVLPLLLGKGTKLSEYLINHDKEYEAVIKLEEKTDTSDSEGKVIERQINPEMDKQGVEQEMYERTLREFKEAKKEELGLPSMRNATEDVSAKDKQEKLRQMNHERKDKTQDKALEVGGVEEQ